MLQTSRNIRQASVSPQPPRQLRSLHSAAPVVAAAVVMGVSMAWRLRRAAGRAWVGGGRMSGTGSAAGSYMRSSVATSHQALYRIKHSDNVQAAAAQTGAVGVVLHCDKIVDGLVCVLCATELQQLLAVFDVACMSNVQACTITTRCACAAFSCSARVCQCTYAQTLME